MPNLVEHLNTLNQYFKRELGQMLDSNSLKRLIEKHAPSQQAGQFGIKSELDLQAFLNSPAGTKFQEAIAAEVNLNEHFSARQHQLAQRQQRRQQGITALLKAGLTLYLIAMVRHSHAQNEIISQKQLNETQAYQLYKLSDVNKQLASYDALIEQQNITIERLNQQHKLHQIRYTQLEKRASNLYEQGGLLHAVTRDNPPILDQLKQQLTQLDALIAGLEEKMMSDEYNDDDQGLSELISEIQAHHLEKEALEQTIAIFSSDNTSIWLDSSLNETNNLADAAYIIPADKMIFIPAKHAAPEAIQTLDLQQQNELLYEAGGRDTKKAYLIDKAHFSSLRLAPQSLTHKNYMAASHAQCIKQLVQSNKILINNVQLQRMLLADDKLKTLQEEKAKVEALGAQAKPEFTPKPSPVPTPSANGTKAASSVEPALAPTPTPSANSSSKQEITLTSKFEDYLDTLRSEVKQATVQGDMNHIEVLNQSLQALTDLFKQYQQQTPELAAELNKIAAPTPFNLQPKPKGDVPPVA